METLAPKTILLLEDEPMDVDMVRRFLDIAGGGGFRLVVAPTVREGLQRLAVGGFDLVLLDQHLPDSDEATTLLYVRAMVPEMPIVVLTGHGDVEAGARKVREGAQDFLVKGGFDAALMVRVIRYAIERAELVREVQLLRQREQREKELSPLIALAETSQASLGDSDDGPAGTQQVTGELVRRYEALLSMAVDQQIYRDQRGAMNDSLRALGQELGELRLTPRAIVRIHTSALRHLIESATEPKSQAFVEAGRHILPEVMGYVIAYYRKCLRS